mmetsp:Transcript_93937/g.251429  ORF Transcript_93937/g.251429 Transcript_93937/m.251429 type:complete len:365 (-) Transcript_93937:105-1199(-)
MHGTILLELYVLTLNRLVSDPLVGGLVLHLRRPLADHLGAGGHAPVLPLEAEEPVVDRLVVHDDAILSVRVGVQGHGAHDPVPGLTNFRNGKLHIVQDIIQARQLGPNPVVGVLRVPEQDRQQQGVAVDAGGAVLGLADGAGAEFHVEVRVGARDALKSRTFNPSPAIEAGVALGAIEDTHVVFIHGVHGHLDKGRGLQSLHILKPNLRGHSGLDALRALTCLDLLPDHQPHLHLGLAILIHAVVHVPAGGRCADNHHVGRSVPAADLRHPVPLARLPLVAPGRAARLPPGVDDPHLVQGQQGLLLAGGFASDRNHSVIHVNAHRHKSRRGIQLGGLHVRKLDGGGDVERHGGCVLPVLGGDLL